MSANAPENLWLPQPQKTQRSVVAVLSPRWRKLLALVFLAVQATTVASGTKAADVRSVCKGRRGPQAKGGGSPVQSRPPGAPACGHGAVTVPPSSSRGSLGRVRRKWGSQAESRKAGQGLLCFAQ